MDWERKLSDLINQTVEVVEALKSMKGGSSTSSQPKVMRLANSRVAVESSCPRCNLQIKFEADPQNHTQAKEQEKNNPSRSRRMSYIRNAADLEYMTQEKELAYRMRDGLDIKDRKHHMKTYKNCFLGKDAVQWLIDNGEAASVEEACRLGSSLIAFGFMEHVNGDYLLENENYFYQFTIDEGVNNLSIQTGGFVCEVSGAKSKGSTVNRRRRKSKRSQNMGGRRKSRISSLSNSELSIHDEKEKENSPIVSSPQNEALDSNVVSINSGTVTKSAGSRKSSKHSLLGKVLPAPEDGLNLSNENSDVLTSTTKKNKNINSLDFGFLQKLGSKESARTRRTGRMSFRSPFAKIGKANPESGPTSGKQNSMSFNKRPSGWGRALEVYQKKNQERRQSRSLSSFSIGNGNARVVQDFSLAQVAEAMSKDPEKPSQKKHKSKYQASQNLTMQLDLLTRNESVKKMTRNESMRTFQKEPSVQRFEFQRLSSNEAENFKKRWPSQATERNYHPFEAAVQIEAKASFNEWDSSDEMIHPGKFFGTLRSHQSPSFGSHQMFSPKIDELMDSTLSHDNGNNITYDAQSINDAVNQIHAASADGIMRARMRSMTGGGRRRSMTVESMKKRVRIKSYSGVKSELLDSSNGLLKSYTNLGNRLSTVRASRGSRNADDETYGSVNYNSYSHLTKTQDITEIQNQVEKLTKHLGLDRPMHWSDKLIISMNNPLRELWSTLMIVCTILMMCTIPFTLAFEYVQTNYFLVLADSIVDFLFIADIAINFLTSYKDPVNKEEVKDIKKISKRYLMSFFVPDVLGSIPDKLIYMITGSIGTRIQYTQLIRMFKIFRLHSAQLALNDLEHYFKTPSAFRLLKISLTFFLILHFQTCAFWFIACSGLFNVGAWAESCTAQEFSGVLAYGTALHYSMAVISGNISVGLASTFAEVYFESFGLLLSIVINATIIGSATTVLSNLDSMSVVKKKQMDALTEYLYKHKINPRLQDRIKSYYEYLWSIGKSSHNENVLGNLPPKLKLELDLTLQQNLVNQCPLLKILPPKGVLYLVQHLHPTIVLPNDIVQKQDELSTSMYFIGRGCVSVYKEDCLDDGSFSRIYLISLHEGSFFGEYEMLSDDEGVVRWCTVVADCFCELQMLNRTEFQHLADSFPEFSCLMKHLAHANHFKMKRLHEMNRKQLSDKLSERAQSESSESFTEVKSRNSRKYVAGEPPPPSENKTLKKSVMRFTQKNDTRRKKLNRQKKLTDILLEQSIHDISFLGAKNDGSKRNSILDEDVSRIRRHSTADKDSPINVKEASEIHTSVL